MQFEINPNSPARMRLSYLFDDGSFTEINAYVKEKDSQTSVVTAYGYVNGNPVYAFSQDKTINGGAVGLAHADKIAKLYALAAKTGAPIVGIHDSNGAYIDSTTDALTAYGTMIKSASNISGVVPQISVVAGTCIGSAAMFASSADFVVMSSDSELYMTQPTGKDSNYGTAKMSAKNGLAAMICDDDKEAVESARTLISMLPANNLSPVPMYEYSESSATISGSIKDIVASVFDNGSDLELFEMYGSSSYTAFATIQGASVGVIGTNKTEDALASDDCSKIARFMRICDSFNIPVITFVDTEGFACDVSAECAGSVKDMTRLAHIYAESTTVKVSFVTGKAYGSAFVALASKNANSDLCFAWDKATISSMAPLSAVEFLWHDKLKGVADVNAERNKLAQEYMNTEASAMNAAQNGCVDDVIEPTTTRARIISALDVLAGKRETRLPKKQSNMSL